MVVDTQRLEAAAAGDAEAMVEVILAEGQGLRLFIAAHVDASDAVAELEQAVWAAVRRQLPRREVSVPLAEWLRWVAAERITRHLQTVDPQGEDLIRLLVQECQAALADGRDQGAAGMATRLHAASADTRELLRLRYAEGEDVERLAARGKGTGDVVASSLAAARAACDWRSGEHPPMGDKLLPRLLEDWFAGVLDPASRALLTEQVMRGTPQAGTIVRQVRLHTMLTVLHQPFGLREATLLARQARQTEARDQASSYRGRAVPRVPVGEPRRPQRAPSSPRAEAAAPGSPSTLPLLLTGAVALVGIVLVVVMNREVGRPADPTTRPTTGEPSTVPSTVDQPPVTVGSVLRPEFGGTTAGVVATDQQLVLAWTGGVLQGSAYAGEALRLTVDATRPDLIAAVDFRAGDRLLATITKAPYVWEWRDPTPFSGGLSARAVGRDGATLATITTPLRILPVQGNGGILREWWLGSPGRTLADGLRATNGFPVRPKGAVFETDFSARRDWADSYLQRMRGYLIPPVDGPYTFWVIGDDDAELWLSSDETSTNLRRIAACPATRMPAVSYGKWEERPQQRSEPVVLKAGRRYYVEALLKENGGDDHLLVGWQLPDGTMERPIPGKRLAPPDEPVAGGGRGSRVFTTGFEDVVIGETSPHFSLSLDDKVTAANVLVLEGDAAEGRRFLRLNDAPGQKNEWTPEVTRSVDFTGGVMRIAFALRVHPGCTIHYGWRHYTPERSYIQGPRFSLDGNGVLVSGTRRIQLQKNAWVHFTVTAGLGSQADGTWDLLVQPAGGTAQSFTALPCAPEFKRLHWVGYSSTQRAAGMCDLDAVTMHLSPGR